MLIFVFASIYSDGLPNSSLATENIIPQQHQPFTLPSKSSQKHHHATP